jgi:hypothetical protein
MEAAKLSETPTAICHLHGVMHQTIQILKYVGTNCLPECDTIRSGRKMSSSISDKFTTSVSTTEE